MEYEFVWWQHATSFWEHCQWVLEYGFVFWEHATMCIGNIRLLSPQHDIMCPDRDCWRQAGSMFEIIDSSKQTIAVWYSVPELREFLKTKSLESKNQMSVIIHRPPT